jgi:hypothetical protein
MRVTMDLMNFDHNALGVKMNWIFENTSEEEIYELINHIFGESRKRDVYQLFFSNSYETYNIESVDISTYDQFYNIIKTFEVMTFVMNYGLEDSSIETFKFLDNLNQDWINLIWDAVHSCKTYQWAMTKIPLGAYYYNIIQICTSNNMLQFMEPTEIVSAKTLDEQLGKSTMCRIQLGIDDKYSHIEMNEVIEIVMDNYCTKLRRLVLRQMEAEYSDYD